MTCHYERMDLDLIAPTGDAMCLKHVVDYHLHTRLVGSEQDGPCVVCVREKLTPEGPVVNLHDIAQVVADAVLRSYDHEGFVVDGEQFQEPFNNEEVVSSVLEGSIDPSVSETVASLIADLFPAYETWFEPFDIDAQAGIQFEWDDFETNVKHVTRLLSAPTGRRPLTPPEQNYQFVRSLLVLTEERAGLILTLDEGTELYRARVERDVRGLEQRVRASPASELGPAPSDRASAGRMNAQGVPLLYVAGDEETACAEVASHSPYNDAVVGAFVLQQPLRILDLTQVPPPVSIFAEMAEEPDRRLSSLGFYVERISRPVIQDGNHPVDYVPSQMLTEAFRWWSEPQLDGIAWPSKVHDGGTNIVLFFGEPIWFENIGQESPRMTRYQRDIERGSEEPVFVIDPDSVRRYEVERSMAVKRAKTWGM